MREEAYKLLQVMRERMSDTEIIDEIVFCYLSGDNAYEALASIANDFDIPTA